MRRVQLRGVATYDNHAKFSAISPNLVHCAGTMVALSLRLTQNHMSNMSRAFVDCSAIPQAQFPTQALMLIAPHVVNAVNAVIGPRTAVELINRDYPVDKPLMRHAVMPKLLDDDLAVIDFVLQGKARQLKVFFNEDHEFLDPQTQQPTAMQGVHFFIGAADLGEKLMETVARSVRCFGDVYFSSNEESPDNSLRKTEWAPLSLKDLCSSSYGGTPTLTGLRTWVGLYERKMLDFSTLGASLGIDEATAIRVPGWLAADDYEKLREVLAML